MRIKVIIAGFTGRMGSAALDMVKKDEELELVALLSPTAEVDELDGVPVYQQKEDLVGIFWDKAYLASQYGICHCFQY